MSILVGFSLKDSGAHAVELAAVLARTTHQDVVVGVVVAGTWPPSPERLDSEYRAYLTQRAEQGIFQARAWMPSDVKTSFVLTEAASVPEGLLGLAREHQASVLVLGSSEAGIGYVSLGGIADRLVHTSDVPVAFAPRGFLPEPGGRVRRVTAAFSGSRKDRDLVRCVATYAAPYDVSLRVASFSVRPKKIYAASLAGQGDDLVVDAWFAPASRTIHDELDEVRGLPEVPPALEVVIAEGYGWRETVSRAGWSLGDLMVVGSSSHGPLASVFLGSRASKILRCSPVPVMLLPRLQSGDLPLGSAAGGSRLARYTDGLVEDRHHDIATVLDQLHDALTHADRSPEDTCQATFDTVVSNHPGDDAARTRALDPIRVATWDLPADPALVTDIRAAVTRRLADWGLDAFTFATELLLSELVTNAIRYGSGPIGVRLLYDGALICEVSDTNSTAPRLRYAATTEEGGRGLFLVAQLAQVWGTRYTTNGKVIWAECALDDP